MNSKKIFTILIILLLTTITAIAYTVPDGDGDGGATGDDTEYTEDIQYDLDAAWVFSGGVPDTTGPSIFYGSKAVQEYEDDDEDDDEYPDEQPDNYLKYYVEDSDIEDNWGQGEITSEEITLEEDWIIRERSQGIPSIVIPPHPEAEENAANRCGDSNLNYPGEKECPEDYGLPADYYADSQIDSSQHETTTSNYISWALNDLHGHFDASQLPDAIGRSGDETESPVNYIRSMSAKERNEDWDIDIEEEDDDETHIIEYQEWVGGADFYLDSERTDEIKAVYPTIETTEVVTEVDAYDKYGQDYDHYSSSHSAYSSCSSSVEGASCSSSTECTSRTSTNVTEYSLAEVTVMGWQDTKEIVTEQTDPGYSEDTNDQSFQYEIDTTWTTTDDEWYYDCTSESTVYSCSGENCSDATGSSTTYYTSNDKWIYDEEDYGTHTIEYEVLTWEDDETIFSTHQSTSSHINEDSRDVLFHEDDIKGGYSRSDVPYNEDGGRTYYSHAITQPSEFMANSPSVSSSKFSINVAYLEDGTDTNNNFISVRDHFETHTADGDYGLGNGYVTIRHDTDDDERLDNQWQITGDTYDFIQQETTTDGEATSFIDRDVIANRLGTGFTCPDDKTHCVTAVDVQLEDLDSWTDPENPTSGTTIETQTHHTSESLGVCKMYQRYTEEEFDLDDDENVQCVHESEGTIDPTCGDSAQEWWHHMEGPEVDEEEIEDSDDDEVKGDYEACITEQNRCVIHSEYSSDGDATEVDEGFVANIAREDPFAGYPGYQYEQDSPDWQVCLNINEDSDYHDEGGQWYNLDDPIVNDYLRGETSYPDDGDGENLIEDASDSDFENPHHIAYYWRENPNPYHSEWNPEGTDRGDQVTEGIALERHCGNPAFNILEGCDTAVNIGTETPNIFYSFFRWAEATEE